MRRSLLVFALLVGFTSWAASTLDKTPSIDSPRISPPGTLDFFFSHDFAVAGQKVINSPTFNFEAGVFPRIALQVQYATSSDVGNVNEAFPSLKVEALSQARNEPLDLAVIGGWDSASESVDGAVVASRTFGFLRPYVAARGFSDGYGVGGGTFAGSLGLQIAILPRLSLVGDVGKVLAASDLAAIRKQNDKLAWSGGIAFVLPYTPHSISLYATNVNTHTPEGASRGGFESWRFGFEFDVPLRNLARFASIFSPAHEPAANAGADVQASAPPSPTSPSGGAEARVVKVAIASMRFQPAELKISKGTTVEWSNQDPVPHTATANDHAWDSSFIAPGASWKHTFDKPGRYPYFCSVHPFMKATVVVE